MKILLSVILFVLLCPVDLCAFAQKPAMDKSVIQSVSIVINDYNVPHETNSVIMHQGVIFDIDVEIRILDSWPVEYYDVGLVINGDSVITEEGSPFDDIIRHSIQGNINLDTSLPFNEIFAWTVVSVDGANYSHNSDVLKIYYESNTPPIIQFNEQFSFDRVFTVPEVTLRGSAADSTGFIKEVLLEFNGDIEDISPDSPDSVYYWERTVLFDAETPVNNIYVTAKDNIGGEYALESTLYWRLIYLDFTPKQTQFCPVDGLFTIEGANIPGGRYQGPGIVNETNLFNPYLAYLHYGAGKHQISYTFETGANDEKIEREFEVSAPLHIIGNSMPCFEAYERYVIELNGHSVAEDDVSVIGDSEYEFDFDEENDKVTIGVWWGLDNPVARGEIVTISALVHNNDFDCSYTINKLIAIDYDYTPGFAELKLFGEDLLVCSLNEEDYYYQWFKNGIRLTNPEKGRSFYHDPEFDNTARYCVRYWNNEFGKCYMEACWDSE